MIPDKERTEMLAGTLRAVLRYPWAAVTIPLGLAMGVGGLAQHALRTLLCWAGMTRGSSREG